MKADTLPSPLRYGEAHVYILGSIESLGASAADRAAHLIREAIAKRDHARIMIATGNSQLGFIGALVRDKSVDWTKVEAFHMDEYVGLKASDPSSLRYWIRTKVEPFARIAQLHYVEGAAADVDSEVQRYSRLLDAAPIDVAFVGFGENGHVAFNDPDAADFSDPATMKVVAIDEGSQRQQVGEGHFKDIASVPKTAVTVTCTALMRAKAWVCSVPERRKAEAVRRALEGPITPACPASIVRRHPQAYVFLDPESSALLARK